MLVFHGSNVCTNSYWKELHVGDLLGHHFVLYKNDNVSKPFFINM